MKNLLKITLLICLSLGIFIACSSNDNGNTECTESTWYEDADGDGLGNPAVSQDACNQPTGYVADNTDTDDDCTPTLWYQDLDGDGLGNPDVSLESCTQPEGYVDNNDDTDDTNSANVLDVDASLFLTSTSAVTITTVPCTLSDGTVTDCYQIVATSTPTDHEMGPWCPDNISDDASAGGIWLEGGQVYDVDGAFIQNMATFYSDTTWQMYDVDGNIYTTETEEDCANAANPMVGEEYENFCVECLPSYVAGLTQTYLIPITPIKQTSAISFGAPGPPGMGTEGPSQRGVAFNGVVFDAPAPTDVILQAYTLAPFDDAGGHINLNAGYHYHAATGVSTQITQADGHASMIGYAIDGHGLYAQLDADGNEPTDLDECRGHTDESRGYHYHADAPGNNNFINCLYGAYAE